MNLYAEVVGIKMDVTLMVAVTCLCRSMQHFQVNFDLYIKFLLVCGVWWLFFMLSLLPVAQPALLWISRVFDVVHGPLVFCVAMCRTRVAFLFKR